MSLNYSTGRVLIIRGAGPDDSGTYTRDTYRGYRHGGEESSRKCIPPNCTAKQAAVPKSTMGLIDFVFLFSFIYLRLTYLSRVLLYVRAKVYNIIYYYGTEEKKSK